MGLLSFFGCEAKDLSPKETELVNKLDFNTELMKELKKETNNELIQLPAIDQETGEVSNEFFNGIHSSISEEKANSIAQDANEETEKIIEETINKTEEGMN